MRVDIESGMIEFLFYYSCGKYKFEPQYRSIRAHLIASAKSAHRPVARFMLMLVQRPLLKLVQKKYPVWRMIRISVGVLVFQLLNSKRDSEYVG
tara:strand:+ start:358 stop:639 length:282 start_codon:yes stop_codon:yes gene_type:complete